MHTRSNLLPNQVAAVQHIKQHDRCALWMCMGGGKSVCSLTAYLDLLNSFDARRMLVVAPKRVARDVWDAEVAEWSHLQGLTVSKIVGTRDQRLTALRKPTDVHTINREMLAWLFSGYVETVGKSRFRQVRKWPWDILALDEAQSFKHQGRARTKAAHRISTFGLAQRIVELTGTPASNGYAGLWSQIFILDHGKRLGRTEDAYLNEYFNPPPVNGYRWTLKPGAAEVIQELLRDICLSVPDDKPAVPVNPIRVTLPDKAMKQYRQMARDLLLEIDPHTISAVNAGVLRNKLLQLASGAIYTDDKRNFTTLHDLKLDTLCELLDELSSTGPVIIGYNFIHELKRIGERLKRYCEQGQKWSLLKSEKELAAFEAGAIDFGVIHPASGGHGLNALFKSGSRNLVWIGPTPDLELWDQLNARIAGGHRRTGRDIGLHVILAKDTVDEDALQMLRSKDVDQVGLVKALRRKL